ncbi:sigma-54-dependent transcriptional regulator [Candidatus Marithrix sp. Canyon 246]|uniref:sigma-54-dependent transcriptional regulator n=1 Tax=Candidatus Marithrix sp. Canyon 246 TaxID=1827136 RepID=UPI000849F0AE|nr:sigma-54 dependent transcriptional regulator [Candidatus Marithrix sp. Canyon 246]
MNGHILVVDDEPDIRNLIKEILEDEGFTVSLAEDGNSAREIRREAPPDLILLDIWMPDIDGISLLKEWYDGGLRNIPIIMISGHGTVETAVEATRLGAYDFIEKPLSISKLLITINRALGMSSLQEENIVLRKNTESVIEPLGHSDIMAALRRQVEKINLHNTHVLLSGESGSGRTLFANYIHQNSQNSSGPFVQMRVTAASADKQSIELFGNYGSSTLARIEQADEGTLFINDIAELDHSIQVRLLKVLEKKSFVRNNGTEQIKANIRVIAATSHDLKTAVSIGELNKELYYYLNILPLPIPPLRSHCEDIPELLEFYINLFLNQDNLPYRRFTVAAQNRLSNYSWPGNIRELKNMVQRLLILANDDIIDVNEIEPILKHRQSNTGNLSIYELPLREAREQFEKAYLEYQLQELGGNVSKVAARIGLERTHLYRKLRSLDIDPKKSVKK